MKKLLYFIYPLKSYHILTKERIKCFYILLNEEELNEKLMYFLSTLDI